MWLMMVSGPFQNCFVNSYFPSVHELYWHLCGIILSLLGTRWYCVLILSVASFKIYIVSVVVGPLVEWNRPKIGRESVQNSRLESWTFKRESEGSREVAVGGTGAISQVRLSFPPSSHIICAQGGGDACGSVSSITLSCVLVSCLVEDGAGSRREDRGTAADSRRRCCL